MSYPHLIWMYDDQGTSLQSFNFDVHWHRPYLIYRIGAQRRGPISRRPPGSGEIRIL